MAAAAFAGLVVGGSNGAVDDAVVAAAKDVRPGGNGASGCGLRVREGNGLGREAGCASPLCRGFLNLRPVRIPGTSCGMGGGGTVPVQVGFS